MDSIKGRVPFLQAKQIPFITRTGAEEVQKRTTRKWLIALFFPVKAIQKGVYRFCTLLQYDL